MVRRRRIGGAAALAAALGAFALCTTASSPTGGTPAPVPAAVPTPAPASAGGGTVAPAPGGGPPVPALEATSAQDIPLQEEGEGEVELDVPPDRQRERPEPRTPKVPALRPMGGVEGASAGSAARLAQTGADARLLGAAGMFLIGVGLALLAPTLPVHRL